LLKERGTHNVKGLKAYLPIENVRLLDATICILSKNKTIIMPVRFFYEFKMILRDLSIYWRGERE
jgi:hypothetical protein